MARSDSRVPRTRSSASPLRSPLTRRPFGGRAARLAFVVLGALVFLSKAARPCSCVDYSPPIAESVKRADVVFAGEVTKLEVLPSWWADTGDRDAGLLESDPGEPPIRVARVTFAVGKVWKGVREATLVVRTFFDCCICGSRFDIGEAYVVYGYRSPSGDQLWTNICTRTKELRLAAEDLDGLGPPIVDFAARAKAGRQPKR